MAYTVSTEEKLAGAIKDDADVIIIEGKLGEKVITIKAKGKVAWAVAFGAIGVAVTAVLVTAGTGGVSTPVTGAVAAVSAPAAVAIIGLPATLSCIGIAKAAGGVGVLNKLRKYRLEKNNGKCILVKA